MMVVLIVASVLLAGWSQVRRWAIRAGYYHADVGYTVHIVVPDDYRGVFQISEDANKGVLPTCKNNGVVQYIIPEDGCLITADNTPFLTWHRDLASYKSGKPLKTITNEGNSKQDIVLRSLGGVSGDAGEKKLVFHVGNLDDFRRIEADPRLWNTSRVVE
jgi:hypothetical protein